MDVDSVDSDVPSGDTATMQALESKLGRDLLGALPDLDSLDFHQQDDEEYLPIYLHLGICGDEVSDKVCDLYFYMKPSTKNGSAPGTCIVIGNTVAGMGKGNTGTQIDLQRLLNMKTSGIAQLVWPFRAIDHPEQFKAVAKWCFIKAAESHVFGFKDHDIPYNESFQSQLSKACDRIMNAKNGGIKMGVDKKANDKVTLALMKLKSEKRTTNISGNVARDVLETGLSNLDDLPPGFLRMIDAPDRRNSSRSSPNSHAGPAIKEDARTPDMIFSFTSQQAEFLHETNALSRRNNSPYGLNSSAGSATKEDAGTPDMMFSSSSPLAEPLPSGPSRSPRDRFNGLHGRSRLFDVGSSKSSPSPPRSGMPASRSEARRRERIAEKKTLARTEEDNGGVHNPQAQEEARFEKEGKLC
ncbi:hypothetical protein GMOD_00008551 [Pyrenophora seminiperda CCB06]|uniref:Uncharacterized protein n=1 Tax=Pyrenophora seminiperda CCB06 TaxID=1302712 RepID=A0A3M7M917_9PLEO|nr:hypothetical protein GMOD_00008551 [Pyrenophora seminiperda CCB06]